MINSSNPWLKGFPQVGIQRNVIHVWRFTLDLPFYQRESLLGILSPGELERAGKYFFEKDRNRFIVARGVLRKIVGKYLNKDPDQICFEYAAFGKPELKSGSYLPELSFNLSHSENIALFAIASEAHVGIDVEHIRYDMEIGPLASRFFSEKEILALERVKGEKQKNVFFQFWTRKEAFLKATGKGLSFPMERCDVSNADNRNFAPVIIPADTEEHTNWFVLDLEPGKGYAAAVVADRPEMEISFWDFSFDL
jgi:4'-phosphopantetheinyl transferase